MLIFESRSRFKSQKSYIKCNMLSFISRVVIILKVRKSLASATCEENLSQVLEDLKAVSQNYLFNQLSFRP